jgi:hypothetical protein
VSDYVPPPPQLSPRSGRSPWMWIGLGCGLLALITFGGCFAGIFVVRNRMAAESKRPLTEGQVIASLRPLPVYPGARVDLEGSRALRAGGSVVGAFTLGKIRTGTGMFRVPAPPDKILAWYDAKLAGWRRVESRGIRPGGARPQHARQYQQGERQALVQIQQAPGAAGRASPAGKGTDSVLTLMLISGVPPEPRNGR